MKLKEYLKYFCCCCCGDKSEYDVINVPAMYEKYDIKRVSQNGIKFRV